MISNTIEKAIKTLVVKIIPVTEISKKKVKIIGPIIWPRLDININQPFNLP